MKGSVFEDGIEKHLFNLIASQAVEYLSLGTER